MKLHITFRGVYYPHVGSTRAKASAPHPLRCSLNLKSLVSPTASGVFDVVDGKNTRVAVVGIGILGDFET